MNKDDFYFYFVFISIAFGFIGFFSWVSYNRTKDEPKRITTAKEHAASWARETSIEYKAITCNDRGYCAINTGKNIIDIYCSPYEEDGVYCVLNPTAK